VVNEKNNVNLASATFVSRIVGQVTFHCSFGCALLCGFVVLRNLYDLMLSVYVGKCQTTRYHLIASLILLTTAAAWAAMNFLSTARLKVHLHKISMPSTAIHFLRHYHLLLIPYPLFGHYSIRNPSLSAFLNPTPQYQARPL
jgi:hypothetical protein